MQTTQILPRFNSQHPVTIRTLYTQNIRLGDRMFDEQKDVERYMEHT